MNNFIFTILFILINFYSFSQSIDTIKADRQSYIWSEGYGISLNKADQEALGMLINQISVQVESRFILLQEESRNKGREIFKETFKNVINTYSNATLRNTERIVINNEPEAKVFRYIKRTDVNKIFAEREYKLIEFARNAEKSAYENRVSDALRYYYWSLTLLRSHPNANSIKITDSVGCEHLLLSLLPQRINSIFDEMSIRVFDTKKDGNLTEHIIYIMYKNQPVRNFDFSYWTGKDWSNIHSAKDGIGVVEYFDNSNLSEIRLKAEYIFEGETAIDNELRDVLSKLEIIPFRKSYFNVEIGQSFEKPASDLHDKSSSFYLAKISIVENPKPYAEVMDKVIEAINTNNFEKAQHNFTNAGFEMFRKLLQYGRVRIIKVPELNFAHFENGVMCRALKMSFNFENNNRNFVEDVVFQFNDTQKIQSVSFGLGEVAIADIIGMDNWSERVRLVLINFLENYKTAYALKRADYIESIFADDALIIAGSVLQVKSTKDNPYHNNQIVRYNRYTKEQFIRNLKHSFASKDYINIRFEDNIIRKSGKGGEVYGIQIKQDYFSSNYGDSGYLFLLIDINNPDQPIIHVRTWQPEKNSDGSIYGLGDF